MNSKFFQNKIVMAAVAILCCALWGISTPIVKMGYAYADAEHVPSLLLWVGIQFLLAGFLTILVYSIATKKLARPKKESLKGIAVISLLQTVLQYALLYIGLLYTSAMKGAILKSTDVFFVMLIASLLFKQEKLTFPKILSCIIGFSGIIVMNLNGLSLNISPLGDGLVVLAIVFYSFAVVMTKRIARNEDPVTLCGYQMALGGVVMLGLGAAFGGKIDFLPLLPIILCLSAIYAVSYTLWTVLLKHHPASRVSIFSFMTPVFGVIFSAFMLNEQGGVALPNLIIALVLVCLGIIIWGKTAKD